MTPFDISTPSRTIFGADTIGQLPGLLDDYGIGKLFLLTDSGLKQAGVSEQVVELAQNAGVIVHECSDAPREPGDEEVDRIVEEARVCAPDAVLGIGGGSVLDIAKLCSVLVRSTKKTIELLDGDAIPEHSLFTILVPTTAGTGSEATRNAIIAVPSRKTKGAVVHEKLLPDLVILDPNLTLSLPSGMTASTGVDALCHAMECFLSVKANAMNDLLAVEAIKLIAGSIKKAVHDGGNVNSRGNMLLASYYAGTCITLSGTNAVHAMSYPLGVEYHIPHGQANAMLLPFVMERNLKAIPEKTVVVASCFGFDSSGNENAYDYLASELHSLVRDIGINTSLEDFGVRPDDLPGLAGRAHANRRLMDNNPMDLSSGDIEAIYGRLMEAD